MVDAKMSPGGDPQEGLSREFRRRAEELIAAATAAPDCSEALLQEALDAMQRAVDDARSSPRESRRDTSYSAEERSPDAGQAWPHGRAILQPILDGIPLAVLLVDSDECIRQVNRAGASLAERSLDEALELPICEALRCPYASNHARAGGFGRECAHCVLRDSIADTLANRRAHVRVRATLPLALPSGLTEFHLLVSSTPVELAGELMVLLVLEDIKERIRSAESLRAIADYIHDWESWLATDGRLMWVSPAVEKLTGYSPDDCLAMADYPLPIVHEASRAEFGELLHSALTEHTSISDHIFAINRKDGSLGWMAISWQSICDQRGGHIGLRTSVRDVTERKRTEEKMLRSDQRLRLHRELSPLGFLEWDEEFRAIEWNAACERIFGYTREEAVGRYAKELIIPEELHGMVDGIFQSLMNQTGGEHSINNNVTKDGRTVICEWFNTTLIDKDGNAIGVASVCSDITERKQAERERQAHLRFFECMDRVNRAIQATGDPEQMMGDVLGVVLDVFECDRAWFVYPCDPDSDTWRSPMELAKPEYPGAATLEPDYPVTSDVADAFRAVLRSPGPVAFGQDGAAPIPDICRAEFGVRAQLAMAVYPKGRKPYMVGVHQCSRERIWTAEEVGLFQAIGRRLSDALSVVLSHRDLLESEAKLREAQRIAKLGNWEWDIVEDKLWWSDEVFRIFGIPRREFGGTFKAFIGAIHPDDRHRVEDSVRQALEHSARGWQVDYRVALADGTIRFVHEEAETIFDPQGKAMQRRGTVQDISERKKTEAERQQLTDQLYHAQKMEAVGELASGVAHDFNNLLTVISGNAELIGPTLARNAAASRALNDIMKAARQASGVTRSLLTLSSRIPVEKERVELREIVGEAARLLKRMMPAAIALTTDPPGQPQVWLSADRTQVQQVIINLAINARDAMPDGGTLSIEVSELSGDAAQAVRSSLGARESSTDRAARLIVRDTGTGMPPEVRARVFEPFFTTKPREQGTGLGLAIVHGIVREHGGVIDVDSAPGQGTTFTITLPGATSDNLESAKLPALGNDRAQGELVLVAEDNESVRAVVATALDIWGFRVLEAVDGASLTECLREHRDDLRLLIVDVDLPQRSGLDCLREIRARGATTPAIIVTGGTEIAGQYNLDKYTVLLRKPFSLARLRRVATDVIAAGASPETGQ